MLGYWFCKSRNTASVNLYCQKEKRKGSSDEWTRRGKDHRQLFINYFWTHFKIVGTLTHPSLGQSSQVTARFFGLKPLSLRPRLVAQWWKSSCQRRRPGLGPWSGAATTASLSCRARSCSYWSPQALKPVPHNERGPGTAMRGKPLLTG